MLLIIINSLIIDKKQKDTFCLRQRVNFMKGVFRSRVTTRSCLSKCKQKQSINSNYKMCKQSINSNSNIIDND